MNEKLKERINALIKLGDALRSDTELETVIAKAASYNPWFTVEFCRAALGAVTVSYTHLDVYKRQSQHSHLKKLS